MDTQTYLILRGLLMLARNMEWQRTLYQLRKTPDPPYNVEDFESLLEDKAKKMLPPH